MSSDKHLVLLISSFWELYQLDISSLKISLEGNNLNYENTEFVARLGTPPKKFLSDIQEGGKKKKKKEDFRH